ncbi:MAG: LuxR C-terminal-related transcriptional regulator [Pirellulaceae bacterium]
MLGSAKRYGLLLVDSDLVRGALLVDALAQVADVDWIDWANSSEDASLKAVSRAPDVILLDLDPRDSNPFETADRLAMAVGGASPLLFLGSQANHFLVRRVRGYPGGGLFNRASEGFRELLAAIDSVAAGRGYLPSAWHEPTACMRGDQAGWGSLKPRDVRLLEIISAGGSNQSAAEELGLSLRSIEKSLNAMRARLGLRTTAELAVAAAFAGVIHPCRLATTSV